MATAINNNLRTLQERVARFAAEEVSVIPDLHAMERFPRDIWEKMGREKLLGVSIPETYGGLGGNYLSMVLAGESFVAHGHNMGLALSWIIHLAVARFLVLGFGNRKQWEELLHRMASGRVTGSLAISEPGTGAHPRYIKTEARPHGDQYVLNGEKAYLTNGPIADLYVVMARTGEKEGRRRFTAFLVPRETPGLTLTEQMNLGFLRPSPHCGIKLENCSVPASNMLGQEGAAYEDIVKPFRELEDVLMMGPIVGGMTRQIEVFTGLVRNQGGVLDDELKEVLGGLQSLVNTLRIMAYEAAAMLDSREEHPEFLSLLLASRSISRDVQSLLKRLIKESGLEGDADLEHITNDLIHTARIAGNVARIKQRKLGENIVSKGVFNETESGQKI